MFKLITNRIKQKYPEKSRTISKKSRDKNMTQIPSRKIPGSRDFTKIPSRPGMKFLGTLDTGANSTAWTVEPPPKGRQRGEEHHQAAQGEPD